jgi:RNA polymerase sigma-70 factor (ECF subfamily)
MPPVADTTAAVRPSAAPFSATHWSVVLAARDAGLVEGADALETLCRAYWPPLYGYVRRQGHAPHDAQDLTQAFFARLLEKDYLGAVDRSKGRFRSFLLASLNHFLANEWRNARSQKRGGNCSFVSFDDPAAEDLHAQTAAPDLTPEKLFERQWATTLLDQVLGRLRQEFLQTGKTELFESLKVFLTGEKRAGAYAILAAELGTTEAALKMAVSRLRRRYGQLLREEIGRTVSSPDEVEGELRALFAALSQ